MGTKTDLGWFEDALESKYAITRRGRLGSVPEDDKELTLLNRVVRWVDGVGLELEADTQGKLSDWWHNSDLKVRTE